MPRDLFEELMKAESKNREMVKLLEAIKPTDLRDQFAMAALTGLASATDEFGTWTTDPDAAKAAYRYADAMLKAREES